MPVRGDEAPDTHRSLAILLPILAQLALAHLTPMSHAPPLEHRAPPRAVQATHAVRAPSVDGRGDDAIWQTTPRVGELRMSSRCQATVSGYPSLDHNDAQWFGNFTDDARQVHHAFAHPDQRTIAMSTRLNYTVTPALPFEFYGQPFVATGTYSNIREFRATPRAAAHADRL